MFAGCYVTGWKLGIMHLHACCGQENFTIPCIMSIQGKCSNGHWLKTLKSPGRPDEYRDMPEQPEGYPELTGQSGGWLTGMLECGNDRDDTWEATAETGDGQACKVIGYQLRLDGACAGARFQFGGPGQPLTFMSVLSHLSLECYS